MPRAVVVLVVLAAAIGLRFSAVPARSIAGPPERERRAGLTFDAAVDPGSRALVEQSVASARPEALRLIEAVDGFVDVQVGSPASGALGTTQRQADGRYDLVLDLGRTFHETGRPGVVRMVLHELGHVVDSELVGADLAASLDAGIPAGVPCPPGTRLGSCAPREERFAETFAKWAMGNDLGATIYSGYAVPPPSRGFDVWAEPLLTLG